MIIFDQIIICTVLINAHSISKKEIIANLPSHGALLFIGDAILLKKIFNHHTQNFISCHVTSYQHILRHTTQHHIPFHFITSHHIGSGWTSLIKRDPTHGAKYMAEKYDDVSYRFARTLSDEDRESFLMQLKFSTTVSYVE